MRSIPLLIITAFVVIGFLTFMATYSVRFTEAAVVTTFDRATEDSVVHEPGLRMRWPYPIQSVTVYDTRARLLQSRSETQQTADNRQIVVESFLTWRVSDPLKFYQRFSGAGAEERDHFREAERTLESLLRSAMSEVSRYRLDDLFTSDAQGSRLAELETAVMDRLVAPDSDGFSVADYGLQPMMAGINRIVLPEETTREVFERMKATRERLASEAESAGDALASTIRSDADSAARRIEAFARRRAQEIRNQGDIEASQWLARLNEDPDLAVFIRWMEFMGNLYGKRATLVLPTSFPGMSLFNADNITDSMRAGTLPTLTIPTKPEDLESVVDASEREERR